MKRPLIAALVALCALPLLLASCGQQEALVLIDGVRVVCVSPNPGGFVPTPQRPCYEEANR